MSYDCSMRIDTGGPEQATVEEIGNYTSNCRKMWATALGYQFQELHGKTGGEIIPDLEKAVRHIKHPDNRAMYQAMNPPNGWGDHDSAAEYLQTILNACRNHPKAIFWISA